jgi:hypothetical protein
MLTNRDRRPRARVDPRAPMPLARRLPDLAVLPMKKAGALPIRRRAGTICIDRAALAQDHSVACRSQAKHAKWRASSPAFLPWTEM